MNTKPINKNPFSIKLPIMALVSITHRISGLILFIFIPFLLWILQLSLNSEADWIHLQQAFSHTSVKLTLWIIFSALGFHFVAGLRHILMDMHIADSLKGGRIGAVLVWGISILVAVGLAYWLWGM